MRYNLHTSRKILTGITLLAALLTTGCDSHEKTIRRPRFSLRYNDNLEIDKIVLNDTLTAIYIDAFHQYNQEIRIDTGAYIVAENRKLPIISAQGIELGQNTLLPESGLASFVLKFPPVPAGVETISLFNKDEVSAFSFISLELKKGANPDVKRTIPREILQNSCSSGLTPLPCLQYGIDTLTIHLLGYQQNILKHVKGYHRRFGKLQTKEITLNFDSTGTAQIRYQAMGPSYFTFYGYDMLRPLYLFSGDVGHTEIWIDLEEYAQRPSRYQNPNGKENRMIYSSGRYNDYNDAINRNHNLIGSFRIIEWKPLFYRDIQGMGGSQYLEYIGKRYYHAQKQIQQNKDFSPLDKELYQTGLDSELLNCVAMAEEYMNEAYQFINNTAAASDGIKSPEVIISAEEKAGLLSRTNFNNPTIIYHTGFADGLLESLDKIQPLRRTMTDPLLLNIRHGYDIFRTALTNRHTLTKTDLEKLEKLEDPFFYDCVKLVMESDSLYFSL